MLGRPDHGVSSGHAGIGGFRCPRPKLVACTAEIEKLPVEARRLKDEYDSVVYGRWFAAIQYRRAIHRMQEFDPPGLDWLDEQLSNWQTRRDGHHETRWCIRRSQRGPDLVPRQATFGVY